VRSVGHGRVETRTIRVINLTGSSDGNGEFFPDARRAPMINCRRQGRDGRWSVQTLYVITSLDSHEAEPALAGDLGPWALEHRDPPALGP
jgi:hypothetical protein